MTLNNLKALASWNDATGDVSNATRTTAGGGIKPAPGVFISLEPNPGYGHGVILGHLLTNEDGPYYPPSPNCRLCVDGYSYIVAR